MSGESSSNTLRSYRDLQDVDLDSQLIDSERVVLRINSKRPAILTDQRLVGIGLDRDSRYRAVSLYPGSVGSVCRIDGHKGRGDIELSTVSIGMDRRKANLPNGCNGIFLQSTPDVRAVERAIGDVLFAPDVPPRKHRQQGNLAALTDQRLCDELREGEQLVWADQPVVRRLVGKTAIYLGGFGLLWTGCGSLFLWFALTRPEEIEGARILAIPLAVLFILIGIVPLSMPYWLRKSAKRTLFAITDRRCIHIIPWIHGYTEVSSFYPRTVALNRNCNRSKPLWKIERPPRFGSLNFGTVASTRSAGTVSEAVGFDALPDPAAVERLIRDTLLAESPEPGPNRS